MEVGEWMIPITIDQMNFKDLDQVLEIETASFTDSWTFQSFETEISGKNPFAYYLVARQGDEVIAYLGVWLILNEAHITNIAVKPSRRKKGIAEKLLNFFFKKAELKNIDAITLEVRMSNEPAQKLYRKLGFVEKGIRPKYYQNNNEDALIMWKFLKSYEID